jgi:hypothetical protein
MGQTWIVSSRKGESSEDMKKAQKWQGCKLQATSQDRTWSPHLMAEETEARKVQGFAQGPPAACDRT